jgi:hypothetical protein
MPWKSNAPSVVESSGWPVTVCVNAPTARPVPASNSATCIVPEEMEYEVVLPGSVPTYSRPVTR